MRRRRDWRARLAAAEALWHRRPYDADGAHCAFFAADCVAAMTGIDLAGPYRGLDRAAAEAALARDGYAGPSALVERHLDEIHPVRAVAGDLALVDDARLTGGIPALGVVKGSTVAVLTLGGLGHIPLTKIRRAFKVP